MVRNIQILTNPDKIPYPHQGGAMGRFHGRVLGAKSVAFLVEINMPKGPQPCIEELIPHLEDVQTATNSAIRLARNRPVWNVRMGGATCDIFQNLGRNQWKGYGTIMPAEPEGEGLRL